MTDDRYAALRLGLELSDDGVDPAIVRRLLAERDALEALLRSVEHDHCGCVSLESDLQCLLGPTQPEEQK